VIINPNQAAKSTGDATSTMPSSAIPVRFIVAIISRLSPNGSGPKSSILCASAEVIRVDIEAP